MAEKMKNKSNLPDVIMLNETWLKQESLSENYFLSDE